MTEEKKYPVDHNCEDVRLPICEKRFCPVVQDLFENAPKYLRLFSQSDIEEILGNSYEGILENFETFSGESVQQFRGWALGIINHKKIDLIRNKTRTIPVDPEKMVTFKAIYDSRIERRAYFEEVEKSVESTGQNVENLETSQSDPPLGEIEDGPNQQSKMRRASEKTSLSTERLIQQHGEQAKPKEGNSLITDPFFADYVHKKIDEERFHRILAEMAIKDKSGCVKFILNYLTFPAHFTQKEIAEHLNLEANTFNVKLKRCIKKISKAFLNKHKKEDWLT